MLIMLSTTPTEAIVGVAPVLNWSNAVGVCVASTSQDMYGHTAIWAVISDDESMAECDHNCNTRHLSN